MVGKQRRQPRQQAGDQHGPLRAFRGQHQTMAPMDWALFTRVTPGSPFRCRQWLSRTGRRFSHFSPLQVTPGLRSLGRDRFGHGRWHARPWQLGQLDGRCHGVRFLDCCPPWLSYKSCHALNECPSPYSLLSTVRFSIVTQYPAEPTLTKQNPHNNIHTHITIQDGYRNHTR